jgi:hypothetical protein
VGELVGVLPRDLGRPELDSEATGQSLLDPIQVLRTSPTFVPIKIKPKSTIEIHIELRATTRGKLTDQRHMTTGLTTGKEPWILYLKTLIAQRSQQTAYDGLANRLIESRLATAIELFVDLLHFFRCAIRLSLREQHICLGKRTVCPLHGRRSSRASDSTNHPRFDPCHRQLRFGLPDLLRPLPRASFPIDNRGMKLALREASSLECSIRSRLGLLPNAIHRSFDSEKRRRSHLLHSWIMDLCHLVGTGIEERQALIPHLLLPQSLPLLCF